MSVPGGVLSVLGKYTATGSFVVALAGLKGDDEDADHGRDLRLGVRQPINGNLQRSQRKGVRLRSIGHRKGCPRIDRHRESRNRGERMSLIDGRILID